MKMADALAQATAHGWQDQSRYTRSTIAEQVSRVTDSFLSTVTVLADGNVQWSVLHLDNAERTQRGTAPSTDAALVACENSIAALTHTLF